MRILIADDHEMIRRGVRSLLEETSQYHVCGEAADGQDAIEKARQLKPDLILMDISMPNLNGLEATREIRRILPRIDVIILSQHEARQMVEQACSVGARGFVVKSSFPAICWRR
jgi:DNA-binding NarL/FixJ family response regulator